MVRSWFVRRAVQIYAEDGFLVLAVSLAQFLARRAVFVVEVGAFYVSMARAAAEFSGETGTPLSQCVPAVRRGFTPESYAFLGLDSKDHTAYVSRYRLRNVGQRHPGPIKRVNGNARYVLHDKLAVYGVFSCIDDHFPTLYGTVHDGRYVSWDDGASQSLLEAVETYDAVVAKPVDYAEGEGFYKLAIGNGFSVNGEVSDAEAIDRLQRDFDQRNYLIAEYVHQHPYSRSVYPETTNTVRIHTVVDPDTGEPFVARPSHRFGTDESVPVDSFARGGVVAPIDPESGELASLVVLDERGRRTRIDAHPDTGAQVAGVTVPMWGEVKAIVKAGARSYPMARIVGWDVTITDDRPVVLEASGHPNPIGAQVERGMLDDPRIRRVFERADVPVGATR